jgi:TatD DNase family protein
MFVDSHAHVDSERYDEDREAMLQRARAAGVEAVVCVGIGDGPCTMQRAADLTEQYAGRDDVPRLYATAGIHPHEARLATPDALAKVESLAQHANVIAIGEIGLDYFYDHSPRELQRAAFLAQMEIAAQAELPIIIHCRPSDNSENAWDDTLDLLEREWAPRGLAGILHCFTGAERHARRAMDIGFMISFAGNITFAKAQALRDIAAIIPDDRLLIETDAPFLAPVPNRGKRNEPAFVPAVAAQLAAVRGKSAEEIGQLTTENFLRFFQFKDSDAKVGWLL